MRRHRLGGSRLSSFEEESVNPMESIANLSDVMLVLAVGMMLAVIVAWKVDVSTVASSEQISQNTAIEDMIQVDEDDTEDLEISDNADEGDSLEDYGLTEAGTVYRDEDGNLYILEE